MPHDFIFISSLPTRDLLQMTFTYSLIIKTEATTSTMNSPPPQRTPHNNCESVSSQLIRTVSAEMGKGGKSALCLSTHKLPPHF